MMKRTLWIAVLVWAGSSALAQNDFRQEYALYDSLPNRARLVYGGAITPLWIDATTFYYETREAGGLSYYKVDIANKTKSVCSQEELPKPPVRVRPEQKDSIPSPDGKWVAFIQDHNLWIE
ncbi:MAG: hypothetical protein FWE99_05170, partial [Bacteroidales bacterium]|nr:hypothetical protein [Bacteroidales bacterium]